MRNLRGGQIRGEGPAKKRLRSHPYLRHMNRAFSRPEVVSWDNEPQDRGHGRCFEVRLLAVEGQQDAAVWARELGLPERVAGFPVAYGWSGPIEFASWVRQNHFFPRPESRDEPINEPYTEDEDVLALRVYADPMHAGLELFAGSGHRHVWRGATLGCIVYDAETGEPLLLSCAHVLAKGAFQGTSLPVEEVGHPIYQPRYPDLAGNLLRWGTNDDPDDLNVDAAVGTVAAGRTVRDGYYGPYGEVAKAAPVTPQVGDYVVLVGRSSGEGEARVVSVNASITVSGVHFAGLIETTSLGVSGDSGSLVRLRDGDRNPVGILSGINLSTRHSFFIPATLIEEDLGVSFLPVEEPPAPTEAAIRSYAVAMPGYAGKQRGEPEPGDRAAWQVGPEHAADIADETFVYHKDPDDPGGGGHEIQDDGTPLAQRAALNFVGFSVSDDALNDATVVEAPATGGGGAGAPAGYAATIGDGTNTVYTVTHNLGTYDVVVQVYDLDSSPRDQVGALVEATSANTVRVSFTEPPDTDQYRVIVVAATATLTADAAAITYTPAVLTDWDSDADPGDAADALDQLAERVDDLEAGEDAWPPFVAQDADGLHVYTDETQTEHVATVGRVGEAPVVQQQEFTTSGTWTVPEGVTSVKVLVVAGGGGGGSRQGGGGGAGGVLYDDDYAVTPEDEITVTVGAGGDGGTSGGRGADGGNSAFGTLTAIGGGGGGGRTTNSAGASGGSGGGGANSALGGSGAVGPPRQGYDGGRANAPNVAGGGGGAGGAGEAGSATATTGEGGDGGAGVDYGGVFGTSVGISGWFAGGGGGSSWAGTPGSATAGGGAGARGDPETSPGAGTPNSGSGGGGSGTDVTAGGNGGSGIVIVQWTEPGEGAHFGLWEAAVASLPTPSALYRGKVLTVAGGAGVADAAWVCLKGTDDEYTWREIALEVV